MSYQFYLLLHVISIVGWTSLATLMLLHPNPAKQTKIGYGIFSLTLFVAGFGLLAKTGISASTPWVTAKLAIWVLLAAIVPIISKRMPEKRVLAFWIFLLGVCAAASFAIYQV